jgi:hypothetical protein
MMISFCLAAPVTAADRICFNKSGDVVLGAGAEGVCTGGIRSLTLEVECDIACILPPLPDGGMLQPPRKDLNGGTIIIKD